MDLVFKGFLVFIICSFLAIGFVIIQTFVSAFVDIFIRICSAYFVLSYHMPLIDYVILIIFNQNINFINFSPFTVMAKFAYGNSLRPCDDK